MLRVLCIVIHPCQKKRGLTLYTLYAENQTTSDYYPLQGDFRHLNYNDVTPIVYIMTIHDNIMPPGQVIDTLLIQGGQMTQQSLADALNVSRKTVNGLIRGHSGLTADMAVRLEKITLVPADAWLGLQMRHDVFKAKQKLSQNPVAARLRPLPVAKKLTQWRSMTPGQRDFGEATPARV